MKVKTTYLDDLPKVVKENHKHNDKFFKPLPLEPALIISTKINEQLFDFLIDILRNTSKIKKINVFNIYKLANANKPISNINVVKAMPFWAKQLSKISFLAGPAFSAVDLKKLGNFIVSVGSGENLYLVPHLTTFHIALLTNINSNKKFADYTVIRPEIVVVLNNNAVYNRINNIRSKSLGKPTIHIKDLNALSAILTRAINIYNKMPFRWVKDLEQL